MPAILPKPVFHRSKAVVAITALRSPAALAQYVGPEEVRRLREDTPYQQPLQPGSLEEQIIASIGNGDEEQALALVQPGLRADAEDEVGLSLMHHAAEAGMLQLMDKLKAHGGNENAVNIFGESVLAYALLCNAEPPRYNSRLPYEREEGRNRILAVTDKLLEWRVNLEEADIDGNTAVLHVASIGDLDVMQRMRKAGANLHSRNYMDETDVPFRAAQGGHYLMATQLMQWGVDPRVKGSGAMSAYDVADTLVRMSGPQDQWRYTETAKIFAHAEMTADVREVAKLPVQGQDLTRVVNKIDAYRQVHEAAVARSDQAKAYFSLVTVGEMMGFKPLNPRSPEAAVFMVARDGQNEPFQAMIQQGFSASGVDAVGFTPAMVHVRMGHHNMVQPLKQFGCDVNAQDALLNCALHHACDVRNREGVRVLLAQGANPLLKNWKGLTPRQQMILDQQAPYTDTPAAAPAAGRVLFDEDTGEGVPESLLQRAGVKVVHIKQGQSMEEVFAQLAADDNAPPPEPKKPDLVILSMLEMAERRWLKAEQQYEAAQRRQGMRPS